MIRRINFSKVLLVSVLVLMMMNLFAVYNLYMEVDIRDYEGVCMDDEVEVGRNFTDSVGGLVNRSLMFGGVVNFLGLVLLFLFSIYYFNEEELFVFDPDSVDED